MTYNTITNTVPSTNTNVQHVFFPPPHQLTSNVFTAWSQARPAADASCQARPAADGATDLQVELMKTRSLLQDMQKQYQDLLAEVGACFRLL